MPTIMLYGHDKLYRDLYAGRLDKDARSDISMENNRRSLGANPKQRRTLDKLARGDFKLLVAEDGTLSVTMDKVDRPKVPTLVPTDWLARRIPSVEGQKAFNEFVTMLKARYPEAGVATNAEHLSYNMNVTPPMLSVHISMWDLTGAEWDEVLALANERRIPHYARYDNSCEPHIDTGGRINFKWPMEVYYPEVDSDKTKPFQNFPFKLDKDLPDTRKSAEYRNKVAACGPKLGQQEVLVALKTKPASKSGWGGPWYAGCGWTKYGRRAMKQLCEELVAEGLAVVKIEKGKKVYYPAPDNAL